MIEERQGGFGNVLLFLLILAAAAGIRLWYVGVCSSSGATDGPIQVQDRPRDVGNEGAAEKKAAGAPLYPCFLSLVGQVSSEPGERDRLVRWIQCGLGALTAGLYYFCACRAFGSRWVGSLAGLLGAIHPFWIANTAEINDGVAATFLLAVSLTLGGRVARRGGYLPSWLFGLALAGLALVRGALMPFAWVAILWYLFRCRSLPRGWVYALLGFLGFTTGLAPGVVYNLRNAQGGIPAVTSTYLQLWQGNNPQATGGPWPGEVPGKTNRELAGEVVQEVRSNLAGTLQRRLWAAGCFVLGEDWFQQKRLWREDRPDTAVTVVPEWVTTLAPGAFYATLLGMLLLALLGWRWSFNWRRPGKLLTLAAVCIPLPYILSHAEALQGPRLPLDGVLLCFAAFALAWLVPVFGRPGLEGEGE